MSTPEELAKKREEIEKAVAAARAAQEAAADADAMKKYYGTHFGMTCDGCSCNPMQGFRWHCTQCANHDLCNTCHEAFKSGSLLHKNKINTVSKKIEDHKFVREVSDGFKPFVKDESGPKVGKKVKPNESCPCGSTKKYKKCCGDLSKKN